MQWTCQHVVKTGTPREWELMVLLGGGVNLFQGELSPPSTGWLNKPLSSVRAINGQQTYS